MRYLSISEIVKSARNGRSQAQFAEILGVKQASISRYESGKAFPSGSVLEACMRMVHADEVSPSADELAKKIKACLNDDKYSHVRLAIISIIDNLAVQ